MVRESRRKQRPQRLMGSHQRCWIWGRHVVLETLRAGRWRPLEVILARSLSPDETAEVRELTARIDVPVVIEPAEVLTHRCRAGDHQGFAAKMPSFPYADAAELLGRGEERPLYVVLDAVQDPYNFGAILRSADVFGASAVFVGEHGQATVSSFVTRSSAGAVNFVPLARTSDLVELARTIRSRGVRIAGASEKGERPLFEFDFQAPSALIIGNEGSGIRPELLEHCDELVTIPQHGHVGSLNAAVSAGILLYEARRQRRAHQE